MKTLCVCDEGVSRSVHLASVIRYTGHETISVGVNQSSQETREMLSGWADLVLCTDEPQTEFFPAHECLVWPIADIYPRPFNPALHRIVREYVTTLPVAA